MTKIKYSDLHIKAINLARKLEGLPEKIKKEGFSEKIIEVLKKQEEDAGIKYFDKPAVLGAESLYLSHFLKRDVLIVLMTPPGDQELETKLPQIIKNFEKVVKIYNYDSRVKSWSPEDINCEL